MVKCESLRMNMYRITHTGKSMNFPVTIRNYANLANANLTLQAKNRVTSLSWSSSEQNGCRFSTAS